jgi:hypothetical protein
MSVAGLKSQPFAVVYERMNTRTPVTQVPERSAPSREMARVWSGGSNGAKEKRDDHNGGPGSSGSVDAGSPEMMNASMPGQEEAGLLSLRTFERVWKYLRF